jgi:hypothetical protein
MEKEKLVDWILEKLIDHDQCTLGFLDSLIDEFRDDRFALTLLVRYLDDPTTYELALKNKIIGIQDLDSFQVPVSDELLRCLNDTPEEIQMGVEEFIGEIPTYYLLNENELLMALLDAFEKDPISYEKPMSKQLERLRVHEDHEVVKLARRVLSTTKTLKSLNITGGTVTGYVQNQQGNLTQVFK